MGLFEPGLNSREERMTPELRHQPKPSEDKGFILVVVLWSAVLLALFAAGFSGSVRTHIRSTASAMELARAEALANGGINLALLDLITARRSPASERRFPVGGQSVACRAADRASLVIRIEDEAGKVNLNLASESLLAALFSGLGATSEQASSFASRVMDFRDGDDEPRPGGAERDSYLATGWAASPKNSAFDNVDEIEQVLGLPSHLTAQSKAIATVHSGLSGVDPIVMVPALRAALDAASLQDGIDPLERLGLSPGRGQRDTRFSATTTQRAFSIRATAQLASGVQFASHAIIEFQERAGTQYMVHQWRHGSTGLEDMPQATSEAVLPPC